MVLNALKKIHTKIVSRLRPTTNLTNPWNGEFSLNIPREVFHVLLKHVVQRNSHGHQYKESTAVVNVERKKPTKNNGRCEVIVDNSKPLTFRYNKNSEVLSVNFHYGFWNGHGVPQH